METREQMDKWTGRQKNRRTNGQTEKNVLCSDLEKKNLGTKNKF
jgi:hypothetical protein